MSRKKFRKIFVLNELKSKNIDKAVFLLKDGVSNESDKDIITEAEEIVNNYVNSLTGDHHRPVKAKKRGFFSRILKNP